MSMTSKSIGPAAQPYNPSHSRKSQSFHIVQNLRKEDFIRIQQFEALPRACILKNLIKQRRE